MRTALVAVATLLVGSLAMAQDRPVTPPNAARDADVAKNGESSRDVAALAPGEDTATTLVVDALSREPISGALLTWYAEREGLRAPALGTARSDRYGLASLDWTTVATWDADSHYVVEADGYAPAYGWGEFPPARTELVRATPVRTRIVDLLGRPVAATDVEVFMGAGHGPTVEMLRTDADGRLTVEGHDPHATRLWLENPTIEADYLEMDAARRLGARVQDLTLAPGGVAEGTVSDPAGRPLEGVEVRSYQRHRGPVGLTDRAGHFELRGVAAEATLFFMHPNANDGWTTLDGGAWRAGTPLSVTLAPWGFAWNDPEPVRVAIRVLDESGQAVEEPEVVLVSESDGRVFHQDWAAKGSSRGVCQFDVPPGLYVTQSTSPFGAFSVAPLPIDIRRGAPNRVTLRARSQARLVLDGDLPDGLDLSLAIEGAAGGAVDTFLGDDREAFVPTDGDVTLGATYLGRTFFFAAGPTEGGERRVHVALARPHVIHVPADAGAQYVLRHNGVACAMSTDGAELRTYAAGDLELSVTSGEVIRRIAISLPETEARELGLTAEDLAAAPTVGMVRVRLPPSLGKYIGVEFVLDDGTRRGIWGGGDTIEERVTGGGWVHVTRSDHVTWSHRFEGPKDVRVEWGDAALTLRVVDADGAFAHVTVVVDGHVATARDADEVDLIRVLGLQPGPHAILILPHDETLFAKELRVVLAEATTRREDVTLKTRE